MSPKPKLLIVADTYYPKVDGVIRFMEEFIKRAKDHFELALLVPAFDHSPPFPGVKTIFLDASSRLKLSTYPSIRLSFKNFKKIKQAVKEAELVFVQGPATLSYLSIYFAHRCHKKIISYIHMFSWEIFEKNISPFLSRLFSPWVRRISINSLNHCHLLLLPYHKLKEELQNLGIQAEMREAKLGIDINRFLPVKDKSSAKAKLKLPPDKTIIGYVGRISPEKNLSVLLRAFNKLNPEKYFLLLVGDGDPEIVRKFKENRNCQVTGFVENVSDYYPAMDIFVMPSLVETTSLATLEAMSCGLPVIATKVGFMKEYITKGYNGLFFPRTSPAILAMKIERLRKNPELREKLSLNARKTVAYSFSWERSISKIKRLLLKVYYQP